MADPRRVDCLAAGPRLLGNGRCGLAAALTLPADEVAQLDRAAADIPIVGERYSPPMQHMIDR